jgi:hypothetical protein
MSSGRSASWCVIFYAGFRPGSVIQIVKKGCLLFLVLVVEKRSMDETERPEFKVDLIKLEIIRHRDPW